MSSKLRRFEVLLPTRFNDGREVPGESIADAIDEIIDQFGSASFYKESVEGYWQHGGTLYRDDLGLIVADVPNDVKSRNWMKAFKARWKERLEQLEIWMVSYVIDVE
jgi:hypothetical protein